MTGSLSVDIAPVRDMVGVDELSPRRHRPAPADLPRRIVPLLPPGRRDPLAARRGIVPRQELFTRLSGAREGGVVVVCAPAGSGKSVLVHSWVEVEGLGDRVAWVTVEQGEQHEQRFLFSLVTALAEVDETVKRAAPASNFRGELPLARLLSELTGLAKPVVLVIDDLHELRSAQALLWLERLLIRRPPRLCLVLAGREPPHLGLHRLRLAGELIELLGPDLRFSLPETRRLLDEAGVGLSLAEVTLLHERTEGWAAGLRLATIALAGHPEPERFVSEFSGGERTVAGYLLAEVLDRQPTEVRELLLRTSVLDRVCGPLADHLTGDSGSERVLQQLEDSGAFVTSLDAERSWFRYHRLFAELLRLELRRVAATSIPSLHRAAAHWHQRHGDIVEAIHHAQVGDDWGLAARLLADHLGSVRLDGRIAAVRELARAFPPDAPGEDAELALVFATLRISDGMLDEGAAFIDVARRLADTIPADRRRRFDLQLAGIALSLARRRGEADATVEAMSSLKAALASQPEIERVFGGEPKATALQNLGVTEFWSSHFDDARCDLEQALALARRVGRPHLEIDCLGQLAIDCSANGLSLADGLKLAKQAVAIAEECGWADEPVIAPGWAAGATILAYLGRFEEVEQWLARARRACVSGADPGAELMIRHACGLLRLAEGRLDEALRAFGAAQRARAVLSAEHPIAVMVHARVLQTRVRMGQTAGVRAALAGLDPYEHDSPWMRLTTALLDLADGSAEHALEVLAPVIEGCGPPLRESLIVTEALVLDAVARAQLGDRRAAEASLEWALELAEPEGIVLPFVLAPAQELVEGHPRHRTTHAMLLRTILDVLAGSPAKPQTDTSLVFEELTEAELRIVRYLPSNLKAPEIAAEVYLSANTVRTHIRHIYLKLGAHDRSQAVARARELGLLARAR